MLLFISPVVVIVLLSEIFLRNMDTTYTIKHEQLLASSRDIELLIVGNSHAAYGLDPEQFSLQAFNLAEVGQSLYFDKRITLKYIDRLNKLKYVLISVDFHSLYFSDQGNRNSWSYYGYGVSYKNAMPVSAKYSYLIGFKAQMLVEFARRALDKKYNTVRALDVESGATLHQPFAKGFLPLKDSITDLEVPQLNERAGFFNDMVHLSHEREEVIADLEDFIGELQKRKITPILITLPVYTDLRDRLDKKVLEQNDADIRRVSDKYHVPYWDYFSMRLSSYYFYNADHLSKRGAAYVSAIVNKRMGELTGDQAGK